MKEEIKSLFDSIHVSGATLVLKDGKLLYAAPAGTTQVARSAILATLRTRRDEIRAFLESEGMENSTNKLSDSHEKTCDGCYSVAEGVNLHQPRGSYHYEERW